MKIRDIFQPEKFQ